MRMFELAPLDSGCSTIKLSQLFQLTQLTDLLAPSLAGCSSYDYERVSTGCCPAARHVCPRCLADADSCGGSQNGGLTLQLNN